MLRRLQQIEGLERLRFLTSHPNWMTDELLDAVAELPKVMPHIEVPIQAGDDQVLANMRRGYTSRRLPPPGRKDPRSASRASPSPRISSWVFRVRPRSSSSDTYDLLAELTLDVAHLARYSPRAGTVSARRMADDVPDEEKWRRFRLLEELQEQIATEIHARYLGQTVPVLFEEKVKNRWKGRTPTNKLVFVESQEDLRGQVRDVTINWTGPWSMIGEPGPELMTTRGGTTASVKRVWQLLILSACWSPGEPWRLIFGFPAAGSARDIAGLMECIRSPQDAPGLGHPGRQPAAGMPRLSCPAPVLSATCGTIPSARATPTRGSIFLAGTIRVRSRSWRLATGI